jgi:two-component system OmpR family sensor kinase
MATGEVRVQRAREGTHAVLRVSDRGPGVPPDGARTHLRAVLPAARRERARAAWAWAWRWCKSIAQRHGGSVRCEDAQGGGAQFTVTLPCNQM